MKKISALIMVFVFSVAIVGMVSAQADTRTPEEKLQAAESYVKVLDAKIVTLKKAGKTTLVKQVQAQKATTLTRMQAWKAEIEAKRAAPPPPPPPPRQATPPAPVYVAPRPAPAPSAGLFGWGLNTGYSVGYLMGKSVIGARADLILDDPMGIGPMLGLSSKAVTWKVGLGGATGKDINDKEKKAIPLFADGIISIPADVMGGIESYVGGGVNYVLYGSEKTGGSYGGQIYYGIQGDVGLGGKSYAELSYSIIRSGTSLKEPYSMKGIGINFGTQIVL